MKIERNQLWKSPNSVTFRVISVNDNTVTVDTYKSRDGTKLTLRNERDYSKAEMDACNGWRLKL